MQLEEYRGMMDKIQIPEDMDKRLKKRLLEERRERRKMVQKAILKKVSIAAAIAVVLAGASQIPVVGKAAEQVAHYFKYGFSLPEGGENEMVSVRLTLRSDSPMKEQKMDSVAQAGEAIGQDLLESTKAYSSKNAVHYEPSLSKNNELYGVAIRNNIYSVGDLAEVSADKASKEDLHPVLRYKSGRNYASPIGVQISVRSDRDCDGEYVDKELNFASENQNIDLSDKKYEAEIYKIPKLDVKAVLYTEKTDGPVEWGLENKKISCTNAVFVYKGVEYVYYGGVDHETMKDFLNTLN